MATDNKSQGSKTSGLGQSGFGKPSDQSSIRPQSGTKSHDSLKNDNVKSPQHPGGAGSQQWDKSKK